MENKVRAHAIITGRVQGVFFRMETQRAARSHGVNGWVRNKMDGSVEAVFEGDEAGVKATLAWCHQGPPHAGVSNVDVTWQEYVGEFSEFSVTY
ncbi:MAG: acylphosphatase [Deltaproteobacteria bacterium]|nr:acylphosphatase [Deltaproteobacteria bacterium]MBW2634468.1 acylphosphatase [Deltaproteobacteria bacterium]